MYGREYLEWRAVDAAIRACDAAGVSLDDLTMEMERRGEEARRKREEQLAARNMRAFNTAILQARRP